MQALERRYRSTQDRSAGEGGEPGAEITRFPGWPIPKMAGSKSTRPGLVVDGKQTIPKMAGSLSTRPGLVAVTSRDGGGQSRRQGGSRPRCCRGLQLGIPDRAPGCREHGSHVGHRGGGQEAPDRPQERGRRRCHCSWCRQSRGDWGRLRGPGGGSVRADSYGLDDGSSDQRRSP